MYPILKRAGRSSSGPLGRIISMLLFSCCDHYQSEGGDWCGSPGARCHRPREGRAIRWAIRRPSTGHRTRRTGQCGSVLDRVLTGAVFGCTGGQSAARIQVAGCGQLLGHEQHSEPQSHLHCHAATRRQSSRASQRCRLAFPGFRLWDLDRSRHTVTNIGEGTDVRCICRLLLGRCRPGTI